MLFSFTWGPLRVTGEHPLARRQQWPRHSCPSRPAAPAAPAAGHHRRTQDIGGGQRGLRRAGCLGPLARVRGAQERPNIGYLLLRRVDPATRLAQALRWVGAAPIRQQLYWQQLYWQQLYWQQYWQAVLASSIAIGKQYWQAVLASSIGKQYWQTVLANSILANSIGKQ